MPTGTIIERQWILLLKDGTVVIDWGDGLYQDVYSGDFSECQEGEISHRVQDDDLELLKRTGRVEYFDAHKVYFNMLPERPARTIE